MHPPPLVRRAGPLKHIKTTVPSVKGDIHLELRNGPDAFTMDLASPAETTAIIGIPRRDTIVTRILANGRRVWIDGKPTGEIGGLIFAGETEHYITFSLQPGLWALEATW